MTIPALIKEAERTQGEWNRKARDLANLTARRTLGSGATGARPVNPTNGQIYYDDTLKIPVWWNTEDAEWKNAAGVAA